MNLCNRFLILLAMFNIIGSVMVAKALVSTSSGIRVRFDSHKKSFQISVVHPEWTFELAPDETTSRIRTLKGRDRIGGYKEVVFVVGGEISFRRSIRVYDHRPILLFKQVALDSISHSPKPFPVFTELPQQLFLMTFSEHEFGAPPLFYSFGSSPDTAQRIHSGPLLFYDSKCNACIISPAGDFMIASSIENGSNVSCGLNSGLEGVPRGFEQATIVAIEPGINRAWDSWGRALTDLYSKKRPSNHADVGLKYLGYWTDNGASYYYRYDTAKGYEGTLLALKKQFDLERIPIRSLQLDSWWYSKGYDNPDGSIEKAEKRIPDLPAGSWNRFGGLLQYAAPTDLFPGGIKRFHDSLGLPLITHNRWISRSSPYRSEYTISGIGSVDRRWWDEIMKSISSWGVVTYEQDWLDRIYENSPEFSSTTWAGEEFMDGMANAAQRRGLTMQYCMALPRHYLQGGAKYSNLTTIRVSGDRFQRSRWKEFLYGSRLASALGVWPWTDVFMSSETPNILLATLSAGMVGIGDEMGKENIANISKSVRFDGAIVKPDVPLIPIDRSYVNDGTGNGIRIATTYTEHGSTLRTLYLFAYSDSPNTEGAVVAGSEIGLHGRSFAYDYFEGTGTLVGPNDSLRLKFTKDSYAYVILAPIGPSGIALLGDTAKFVTCGRNRISKIVENKKTLTVTILLAKGEQSVSVCGFAPKMPQFMVYGGFLTSSNYDSINHIFKIEMNAQENLRYRSKDGDRVGTITMKFKSLS